MPSIERWRSRAPHPRKHTRLSCSSGKPFPTLSMYSPLAPFSLGQIGQPGARTHFTGRACAQGPPFRSEEHTSELQSLMRISYAVFCLKNKNKTILKHYYSLIIHKIP